MRSFINLSTIIMTAANIADTEGLDAVTLTRTAEKLNIKKQSLYNHIKNLAHLKCELIIYANAQLRQHLIQAVIGKAREEAILGAAESYRNFAHDHPGQYQAIISLSWEFKDDEKFQASTHALMEILFKILSAYQLHEDYLTHAVRGLRSIMHGFISLENSGWFHQPIDKDESYRLLLQTFINGIKSIEKK
ncbi:TetR-like C-terminal domain-containing protein [Pectinatus frisingensis]|uniref:TetR-like C-terminal domain-containing protein n=1 Tax=Pectinatus frisingensis TaxID=865 RepID=UPI0018C645F6|nr:TetR-like C-terminal domain-containing protein [Pectinatus frisingensis]